MVMTKDQIINKIKRTFKGVAVEDDRCRYLTSNGRKCAIGLFIPNGRKAQKNIGTVAHLLYDHPYVRKYMPSKNLEFLTNFQRFHDNNLNKRQSIKTQKQHLIDWINKNYDKYNHNKEQ